MSSYATLTDPHHNDERAFASATVAAKFCNWGIVTSRSWMNVYITVLDGIVRMYDDRKSCEANPMSFVMEIQLKKDYQASAIKSKNYSMDRSKIVMLHCFYIEINNGILAPTRLLKIGCLDEPVAERLREAIMLTFG